jgi:RNA polymerase sigma-70 factor (ECF subfamily)
MNRFEQAPNDARPGRDDGQQGSSSAESESAERNRAETFLAFHAQSHNRLSAFVHTLVPTWQDAEEIVQDTLVVLWRKFDEFDPSTNFFSWAARVAQYEVLNYRRRNRHRVLVLEEDILEAVAKTAIEQMDDMELHREALEHCIKKLPERDREIVGHRYREGGDIQSAADAVHRTTGHVQRILRKIRAGLLRCIHVRLSEFGI